MKTTNQAAKQRVECSECRAFIAYMSPHIAGHLITATLCDECDEKYLSEIFDEDEDAIWIDRDTSCQDCGETGERTGHMTCQYPQNRD